jgi:hypothetical protein
LIFLLVTTKGKLQKGVLRFYNYDTKNNFTSSGDRSIFFIAPIQSNNLRQGRGDRTTALAKKRPSSFRTSTLRLRGSQIQCKEHISSPENFPQMLVPELSMGILSVGNW